MEFTKNMQRVMECAVLLVREKHHRYFMPEHLLYGMTFDENFQREFELGGGQIDKLRKDLMGFLQEHAEIAKDDELRLSSDTERVLYLATGQAMSSSRKTVGVSHLLSAILNLEDSYGVYFLTMQDVDLVEVIGELSRQGLAEERGGDKKDGDVSRKKKLLEWRDRFFAEDDDDEDDEYLREYDQLSGGRRWLEYVEDMNQTCRLHNPLIGRKDELERTIQILCRREKNNVLHIGEPGVGKTAIAYGLAQRLIQKDVPKPLAGARLYALDLAGLLAGTQYRGDFEKRFKQVMEGLLEEDQPILYLDEIHNIVGAGAVSSGSLDVANLLKPYLEAGTIRFIGATTFEEYKKYFSVNKSLVRRFQNVEVREPSKEESVH